MRYTRSLLQCESLATIKKIIMGGTYGLFTKVEVGADAVCRMTSNETKHGASH